jgi:hypothetical protein
MAFYLICRVVAAQAAPTKRLIINLGRKEALIQINQLRACTATEGKAVLKDARFDSGR